jgi:hypothetical protein
MEDRHGVRGTVHDGVFFSESTIPGMRAIEHLHVEISRQNATLFEVKTRLAEKVKACGATALANFRYGQKKHEWWEQVFSFKWDTESWHGEGDAVRP